MKILIAVLLCLTMTTMSYCVVGTSTRVDQIKEMAPEDIERRGWKILRYEGYEYGSFNHHGGKVWYHVKDLNHRNTYYRVFITLWNNELHYAYGAPEKLQRLNFDEAE